MYQQSSRVRVTSTSFQSWGHQSRSARNPAIGIYANMQQKVSLTRITSIEAQFRKAQASFTPPSQLDFLSDGHIIAVQVSDDFFSTTVDAKTCEQTIPELAETEENVALLAYSDALERVLDDLDDVQSGGDAFVEEARAHLAHTVETEAQRLEAWSRQAWNAHLKLSNTAESGETKLALTAIAAIYVRFSGLKGAFVLPDKVDFTVGGERLTVETAGRPLPAVERTLSDRDRQSVVPPLAFTASNACLRRYDEQLILLVEQLGAIDSGGDTKVRETRKALVRNIEAEAQCVTDWTREIWVAKVCRDRAAAQEAECSRIRILAIDSLRSRFDKLTSTFIAPEQVDYLVEGRPLSVVAAGAALHDISLAFSADDKALEVVPELAGTSSNAQLRLYCLKLDKLLIELDAVDTGGDRDVREQRSLAFRAIDAEVHRMNRWKQVVWTSRKAADSPEQAIAGADTDLSCDSDGDDRRPLRVSLEQIFNGATVRATVTRKLSDGTSEEDTFDVDILPGCTTGTEIRFPCAGNERRLTRAQDLVFVVEQEDHARFSREGGDLVVELPSTQANPRGRALTVETLDGRSLSIPTPSTRGGQQSVRIPGEGMPIGQDGARGDLIVKWEAVGSSPILEASESATPFISVPKPGMESTGRDAAREFPGVRRAMGGHPHDAAGSFHRVPEGIRTRVTSFAATPDPRMNFHNLNAVGGSFYRMQEGMRTRVNSFAMAPDPRVDFHNQDAAGHFSGLGGKAHMQRSQFMAESRAFSMQSGYSR